MTQTRPSGNDYFPECIQQTRTGGETAAHSIFWYRNSGRRKHVSSFDLSVRGRHLTPHLLHFQAHFFCDNVSSLSFPDKLDEDEAGNLLQSLNKLAEDEIRNLVQRFSNSYGPEERRDFIHVFGILDQEQRSRLIDSFGPLEPEQRSQLSHSFEQLEPEEFRELIHAFSKDDIPYAPYLILEPEQIRQLTNSFGPDIVHTYHTAVSGMFLFNYEWKTYFLLSFPEKLLPEETHQLIDAIERLGPEDTRQLIHAIDNLKWEQMLQLIDTIEKLVLEETRQLIGAFSEDEVPFNLDDGAFLAQFHYIKDTRKGQQELVLVYEVE
ncbi:unnamed protein product [Darwinula stevensoni]|uniref:Uncharacterized protein n=1 Tax=Darwinula stevensoni TaxID=69355 RepID=A0A7R8XCL2_9CRUS|nr:unnamed protein product [Darwinula stevensoni]CAG0888954.1 unnamed protein product [Darwinula stevensoni]